MGRGDCFKMEHGAPRKERNRRTQIETDAKGNEKHEGIVDGRNRLRLFSE